MTFEREKAHFDEHGFVIVKNLLSTQELAELQDHLTRYIREVVPTLPDGDAFYQVKGQPETLKQMQHMGRDPFFATYHMHPKWQALAEALIGEAVHGMEPEWFNKPPGTEHPTPPHQDNYYFNLTPPHVVTLWMALDVVNEENGCLRYVRGSHREPIRPHGRSNILGFSQGITDYGPDDESREVAIHLEPGEMVAHHGSTIHRAEPNRSTRHRRAFAIVFQGVSCKRDEDAYARYEAALRSQHDELGLTQ